MEGIRELQPLETNAADEGGVTGTVSPADAHARPGHNRFAIVLLLLIVSAAAALFYPQRTVRYQPGDQLAFRGRTAPVGMVTRYEPRVELIPGRFARAYQLRLHPSGALVWFGANVVEKGMVKTPEPKPKPATALPRARRSGG